METILPDQEGRVGLVRLNESRRRVRLCFDSIYIPVC